MFNRNLKSQRADALDNPFGVEDTPLVDLLYSITRGPVTKKLEPMTPAMKRDAVRKLIETPVPPPKTPAKPRPPDLRRAIARPEMTAPRRARG